MSLTFPAGRLSRGWRAVAVAAGTDSATAEGSKARQVLLTPEILDLDEGED